MHLFWGRSLFKIPVFYYSPPTRENERGEKFPKNLGIPFFTLGVSEMRPIIGPTTPKNTPRKCTQKNAAAAMIAGFSFLRGRFPSKNSSAATTLLVGCANGQVGKKQEQAVFLYNRQGFKFCNLMVNFRCVFLQLSIFFF